MIAWLKGLLKREQYATVCWQHDITVYADRLNIRTEILDSPFVSSGMYDWCLDNDISVNLHDRLYHVSFGRQVTLKVILKMNKNQILDFVLRFVSATNIGSIKIDDKCVQSFLNATT